jgi:RNA recognition motif-containing protein
LSLDEAACRNLWVGNVGDDTNEDRLNKEFGKFGPIEKIKILRDKSCAFVTFYSLPPALGID